MSTIRVVSNQVVVPLLVLDRRREDNLSEMDHNVLLADLSTRETKPWKELAYSGLLAKDFDVFEDGRKRVIDNITVQPPPVSDISDSAGEHYERTGAGEGRWIYPDLPRNGTIYAVVSWPVYLLAYSPPPSPEGSCHHVTIRVKAPHADYYGEAGTYCRTGFAESDPLSGTKFGMKLEDDLQSVALAKIILMTSAVTLIDGPNKGRVSVTIRFQPNALQHDYEGVLLHENIGLLARVYAKNGAVVARYSDFDCCDLHSMLGFGDFAILRSFPDSVNVFDSPRGYNVQLRLPPGRYDLRVVLSDGKNFGRAEAPINVEAHDPQHLALSDIALAKRFRKAEPSAQDPSAAPAGGYAPLISKGVEYTPTANSTFSKSDQFFFFFQIYKPQNSATPPPSVHANLRIVDAKTNEVKIERLNFDVSSYIIPGNPIIPIGDGIDIRNLPPANSRLEVQASDSSGQSTPWHSAPFSVQ